MSSCVSVARIGGSSIDNVAADMLRTSLLHHFAQTQTSASATVVLGVIHGDDQDSSSTTTTTTAPRLTVTNRYFSAHLILQEIGQDPPQQDGDALESSSRSLPFKEDGVILVFDHVVAAESGASSSSSSAPTDQYRHHVSTAAAAAASFNALEPVHDRAEALLQAGELLRLCVGVSVNTGGGSTTTQSNNNNNTKEYEAEYARRILWCLDRGYEYVEVDLSAEGVATGHDVRDKDGFARVVEAVCGTVWSSAVMGGDQQTKLQEQFAQAQAQAATAAAAAADAKQESNNGYEPPDPSKLPPIVASLGETVVEDQERGEKAREAILQQKDIMLANNSDPSSEYLDGDGQEQSTGMVGPDGPQEQRQKENEQERFMNDFEGVLRQASRIRDASKSGAISDDERRQRAGDAADLLMGLMGKMGDFDDDSETEDEEGEGVAEGDLTESKEKE
jgi:hypothetical protein